MGLDDKGKQIWQASSQGKVDTGKARKENGKKPYLSELRKGDGLG